jgi:molybdopterin converting factor small subunit
MQVTVTFYSYCKELAGCSQASEELPEGSTLGELLRRLHARFPRLEAMRNSTLIAVGVEYQKRDFVLRNNDQVSLFPPVQGG